MPSRIPILVFSDPDPFLTHWAGRALSEAGKVLRRLERDEVPLVICSTRTRAEIVSVQQDLGLHQPFICESGNAAFMPVGYFQFMVAFARDVAGYQAVEFGRPYVEVVQVLHRTASRLRIEVRGFNDMSVDEVARECHLPLLQARLAKLREYGERFRLLDPNEISRHRLFQALEAARLHCVFGDVYNHVGAAVDARPAIGLLYALYKRALGTVLTVGPGETMCGDQALPHLIDPANVAGGTQDNGIDLVGWAEEIVRVVERLRREGPQGSEGVRSRFSFP